MTSITSFEAFDSRLREFIAAMNPPPAPPEEGSKASDAHRRFPSWEGSGAGWFMSSEAEFNRLALALFGLQFAHVEPYRRFCEARRITPDKINVWSEIPAIPAAAFKGFDLTSVPIAERSTVFHSSGTTGQRPSRHFHNAASLALYEASLLPWFKAHLLPDAEAFGFVILAPSPVLAPHSSLAHMFETVRRDLGPRDSHFSAKIDGTGAWTLDIDATLDALGKSMETELPVALLGTAFSFVHLLDHLSARPLRFALPLGSRVMETGGYKGRSRTLPRAELHALITRYLRIPHSHIVCEYGMSELSSQAYDRVAGRHAPRFNAPTPQPLFHFPPWARARVVSPETGGEVAQGETGLIQVCDLANVRSVMVIQTEDLAVRRGDGFELIGRAELAEPRGCSLMNS